jgi:hypothetical protein
MLVDSIADYIPSVVVSKEQMEWSRGCARVGSSHNQQYRHTNLVILGLVVIL